MQSRLITEVAFSLLGGAHGMHAPACIAGASNPLHVVANERLPGLQWAIPPSPTLAELLTRRALVTFLTCWTNRADQRPRSIVSLVDLVSAGLASAHPERMVADGKMMEVARVKITEAGRRALTGW